MSKSDIQLLRHILDEISFVLTNADGKDAQTIQRDPVLSRAVIRSLEIIGEASSQLSPEFKDRYADVEWRKISDTRNRLIHNYMGVDYEIVSNIIEDKLPELEQKLRVIVAENPYAGDQ